LKEAAMNTGISGWVLMLASLATAAYAHYRLKFHTASPRQALIARLVLIFVGLGFGWSATLWTVEPGRWANAVAFLTGFGLVHVPAAFILYIKRLRGVH
jgi:hypothetical protein